VLQGFAVGGEWAGAALLSAEHAPAGKRGRYGMLTQLGVGAGLLLSNNRQGFLDIWGTCLYFADDVLNQGARHTQPLVRRSAPLSIPG
jgi:MFS family permease